MGLIEDCKEQIRLFARPSRKNSIKLIEELQETKALLLEAIEHLDYCSYGDSWERECGRDLEKKLDAWRDKQR